MTVTHLLTRWHFSAPIPIRVGINCCCLFVCLSVNFYQLFLFNFFFCTDTEIKFGIQINITISTSPSIMEQSSNFDRVMPLKLRKQRELVHCHLWRYVALGLLNWPQVIILALLLSISIHSGVLHMQQS